MQIFNSMKSSGLEQLIYFNEESVNLKGILAIHNTLLGPAIGGVRMMDYPDQETMFKDAVDLAHEMTLRTALSDCDLGGGSAVLCGKPEDKDEAYFRAFGRLINRLSGQFLAVMEVGTNSRDLMNIKRETDYVYALPEIFGGIADATEITAEGIILGIKATVKQIFGHTNLEGLNCVVQGVGRLGSTLVKMLFDSKAKIVVTDKNYDKIKNIQDKFPGVAMIQPGEIIDKKCDLIIPCALGNLITESNIERLKCKIIAGGASNILPDANVGDMLFKKGIVYTPHFIIDSGELIQADYEIKKRPKSLLGGAIQEIYGRTINLLEMASDKKEAPIRTALRFAGQRLTKVAGIGKNVKF
ncbi:MAG: Glu/Leu/Phe/Val dehydrogenase [Candidatus Riflebacteria bacterium]|nr:Glu/Leu/Phe/Val dehydrogenase [Candidatus Riflebacteria bacterium]